MGIGELPPQDRRSRDFPDTLRCPLDLNPVKPEDLAFLDKLESRLGES